MGKRGPMPTSVAAKDESVHVAVRKIANGWLASHSWSGPKGYESKEVFHRKQPKLEVSTSEAVDEARAGKTDGSAVAKAARGGSRRAPRET